jgi:hypothetical protein
MFPYFFIFFLPSKFVHSQHPTPQHSNFSVVVRGTTIRSRRVSAIAGTYLGTEDSTISDSASCRDDLIAFVWSYNPPTLQFIGQHPPSHTQLDDLTGTKHSQSCLMGSEHRQEYGIGPCLTGIENSQSSLWACLTVIDRSQ